MKHFETIFAARRIFSPVPLALSILMVVPVWSQTDNAPSHEPVPPLVGVDNSSAPAINNDNVSMDGDDRMLTPPPVSGQTYPTEVTSEEHSNYLRGGMSFTPAYTDNALGSLNGYPVSDVSYSLAPSVMLDETTSRMHAVLDYAPGFTFYQRLSARNEADHNASIDFQYRLSPHVTLSARDSFQKSSNVFNQPDLASASAVSGGSQQVNFSVIPPIASRLSNSGNVGLAYQFGRNAMVGSSGTFSNLHYPDPSQVPGLYDSSSQAGSAFYSLRLSRMHYVGVTYEYQRLMAYPTAGLSETQTHAVLFFYTVYPASSFSISFFGGPQHSDTVQPPLPPLQLQVPAVRAWVPAAGASLSWQGRSTNFAMSYSHVIAGGGGLIGAVQMDNASAALRRQITKTLTGSVSGSYVQNNILGAVTLANSNGHSLSGDVSLRQQVGEHWSVQLGYTRIHQSYSNVSVLSAAPDTNREFVSLSYQFSRPVGR